MTMLRSFLESPGVARLAWTLLHFLWQGTVLALLLAAFRRCSFTARAQYRLACCALAIMLGAPVLTFFLASGRDAGQIVTASSWRISPALVNRVLPWIFAVWMTGAIAFSIRLIAAFRFTSRLRTIAIATPPEEWQKAFESLTRRIGISRPVRLLVSSLVEVPSVIGWLRPVVLMPVASLAGIPVDQIEAVLAHELAHVWRNDYLVNILQNVAEAMLFYHPAVWWVSAKIRIERELCCDDIAVTLTGDVTVYVRALADLETRRRARFDTALAADGGSLITRVRRLLGEPSEASQNLPAASLAGIASLLWIALISGATAHASPFPPAPGEQILYVDAPATIPLLNTLLFDPFFAPPQAPAPPPAKIPTPGPAGMRANRVHFLYLPDPWDLPENAKFQGFDQFQDPVGARIFSGAYDGVLRSGEPTGMTVLSERFVTGTCPIACVAFETWVEGLPENYVEIIMSDLSGVERTNNATTVQRFVSDEKRHVYIPYAVTMEAVSTDAYRVSFLPERPAPARLKLPNGSKLLTSIALPAMQILRTGDVLAIPLYNDPESGARLVDYLHFGQRTPITLRQQSPREAYASDAEFTLAQPHLRRNGLDQRIAAFPETLHAPMLWLYAPGEGRFLLSLKPLSEYGFERAGEVDANSLTFNANGNVFKLDAAERIAPIGSGIYSVYALHDPQWQPADPSDRQRFWIGTAPGVETAFPAK